MHHSQRYLQFFRHFHFTLTKMPCFTYFYPNWQTGILKKSMQNTYILLPTKFFVYFPIKSEEWCCGQSAHSRCCWNINSSPVQCQEWREAMLRIPISDTFLFGHLNFIQHKLILKLRKKKKKKIQYPGHFLSNSSLRPRTRSWLYFCLG